MPRWTSSIAALLATSVVVSGHPTAITPSKSELVARQYTSSVPLTWTNPDGASGNIVVVFSDTTIGYGSEAPSDVVAQLNTQCLTSGICDTTQFTTSASTPAGGGGLDELIITGTAAGEFPPASLADLVGILSSAVGAAQTYENVTYSPNTACFSGPDCVWEPDTWVLQYTGPEYMAIIQESSDPNEAPVGYIDLTTSVEAAGAGGFCSTFATVGPSIASVFSPPAGAALSFLGLACQ